VSRAELVVRPRLSDLPAALEVYCDEVSALRRPAPQREHAGGFCPGCDGHDYGVHTRPKG
jgi:hypothetical protein